MVRGNRFFEWFGIYHKINGVANLFSGFVRVFRVQKAMSLIYRVSKGIQEWVNLIKIIEETNGYVSVLPNLHPFRNALIFYPRMVWRASFRLL